MPVGTLETDYLVVGAGAAGMAFADTLVTESEAQVLMVDRRVGSGGHWNDAYAFVRLHQPSMYYGVNSMPLCCGTVEPSGREVGMYGRASGVEICAYYDRVLRERLIPSGRVRFLPQCDYVGNHRIVSRRSGETFDVKVRRRLVDATYLSPSIPASTPPPFDVGTGASAVPVNELAHFAESPERFVIVGAGKTAMDACVWLLENGVGPEDIQWIKPREAWLLNRTYFQPGDLVGGMLEGIARQMEAASRATSIDDLFDRLEAADQVRRVDQGVRPTMYKLATIADWEIDLLRRIQNVVRLGRVRRLERDRIVLDHGTIPTRSAHLHVHCAADGLRRPAPLPIFQAERITLQPVRSGLVPFNAALVAFVEAHRGDDTEKNRLCPPNPFTDGPLDWAQTALIQLRAERLWSREADISEWLERSRLNPMKGLRARLGDPAVQLASRRFAESVGPAVVRLTELVRGATMVASGGA
ncbi:MAG TPA: FAD-dependent oxidoreductase [Anaeromyxobacteraceae bacterium]|nr:FAD-dependent oxidoreductase [Anaeromyxobacteraceae bacterium]